MENFAVEVNEVNNRLVGQLSVGLFDMTLTNPGAQVASAFGRFDEIAPDVNLRVRILGTDDTERGVLNGEVHVGIVPSHRRSSSLDYYRLYTEQMFLFCGATHPFYSRPDKSIAPREIRAARYAGLDFQSPNMLVGQKEKLNRQAQANDQEALALLIQSGRYIGFLPDHCARPYIDSGRMKRVRPDRYSYDTRFFAIVKRNPKPARIARVFLDCLCTAHALNVR